MQPFISASLRLEEQLEIFLESKAYSKMLEIPLVQFAKMQVEFQWQQASLPGVREFKDYFESPEGEEIVADVLRRNLLTAATTWPSRFSSSWNSTASSKRPAWKRRQAVRSQER